MNFALEPILRMSPSIFPDENDDLCKCNLFNDK